MDSLPYTYQGPDHSGKQVLKGGSEFRDEESSKSDIHKSNILKS